MKCLIVGIDPSSAKLAVVTLIDGTYAEHMVYKLITDTKRSFEKCMYVHQWISSIALRWVFNAKKRKVYVYLEAPVLGRGGPGSTIPQVQVAGAAMAALGAFAGKNRATVMLVNNKSWKASVVGDGNAKKEDITAWVKLNHPNIYRKFQYTTPRGLKKIDEDLCDAFCISLYGYRSAEFQRSIEKQSRRVVIRRKPVKRASKTQKV